MLYSGRFITLPNWDAGTNQVEYLIVGAGGGGGGTDTNCWGAGGGGAGQVRTGTTTLTHPSPFQIGVGAGGRGQLGWGVLAAATGNESYASNGNPSAIHFPGNNTIYAWRGGFGSGHDSSQIINGYPGSNYPSPTGSGSGGGASRGSSTGDGGPDVLGAHPGGTTAVSYTHLTLPTKA